MDQTPPGRIWEPVAKHTPSTRLTNFWVRTWSGSKSLSQHHTGGYPVSNNHTGSVWPVNSLRYDELQWAPLEVIIIRGAQKP